MDAADRVRSEIRDGLRIDSDAPIAMDDGLVLHAAPSRMPALLRIIPEG